ncbi:hypothetical protein LZ30DRAFT_690792 [Colletotrichum cereale]|nr:hypothetical protein LZ30DRAFT_690792 [Colletotrichum cereale]
MGLRAAFRGLVSKRTDGQLEQPHLPYRNFTTPLAKASHDTIVNVHPGETRVAYNHAKDSSTRIPVPSPVFDARNTTLAETSTTYLTKNTAVCTENQYTLAEMAARMAYTARHGDHEAQARAVSIPPRLPAKVEPVVIVKRKSVPSRSVSVQGSRTPSPPRSTSTDEPRSDPPSYLTYEGGESVRGAAQKAHFARRSTLGRDEIHHRVTSWASKTTSSRHSVEKPLDVISEEAPSTNIMYPVRTPTKRKGRGKKSTAARSHLARGSMRSTD